MNIITIDENNLDKEHICCSLSDKKGENCVALKKQWMRDRFADGLVFKRLDDRGKMFIEYIPAENAWCPINAQGYMHINCFWVSGKFQGQGYANLLLDSCISDAREKGKHGLTILSAPKKMPFLSDPGYLKHKGFLTADTAPPYFELLYLPFAQNAPLPAFQDSVRQGTVSEQGLVLYFTNQCPFAQKYAELICNTARKHGHEVTLHKIETGEQAHSAPSPFTTYSFFYNGTFVTNEILSEKKFEKFLQTIDQP